MVGGPANPKISKPKDKQTMSEEIQESAPMGPIRHSFDASGGIDLVVTMATSRLKRGADAAIRSAISSKEGLEKDLCEAEKDLQKSIEKAFSMLFGERAAAMAAAASSLLSVSVKHRLSYGNDIKVSDDGLVEVSGDVLFYQELPVPGSSKAKEVEIAGKIPLCAGFGGDISEKAAAVNALRDKVAELGKEIIKLQRFKTSSVAEAESAMKGALAATALSLTDQGRGIIKAMESFDFASVGIEIPDMVLAEMDLSKIGGIPTLPIPLSPGGDAGSEG